MDALDDMRLRHPSVTGVLDRIRAGRSSALQDSTAGTSWLSGKIEKATADIIDTIKQNFASVDTRAGGDGKRVTLQLDAGDLDKSVPDQVGRSGQAVPLVQLHVAQTATIHSGAALVRTSNKNIGKQDCYVLIPYLTEESPATKAMIDAAMAAEAVYQLHDVLCDSSAKCSGLPVPERVLADVLAAATEATSAATAAAEQAELADQSAGFNTHARATAEHAAEAAASALQALDAIATVPLEGTLYSHKDIESAAQGVREAAFQCQEHASTMPAECAEPVTAAPGSICSVLHVEHLLRWTQDKDGEPTACRLVLGQMTELEPVLNDLLQFDTVFCDGTRGRRRRYPTMMRPAPRKRPYKYAVYLDQVECTMVTGQDSKGARSYIPTSKSGLRG
jgi:hypothetical protein